MIKEYIEIVHADNDMLDLYKKGGKPLSIGIVNKIRTLERVYGINHIEGILSEDMPTNIPLDTPIRVGGGLLEESVRERVQKLKDAGYSNVKEDRTISFSWKD